MENPTRRWGKLSVAFLAIFIFAPMFDGAMAREPIIIDHNCTDLSRIPDYWLDQARTKTFHYAHTSHGGQITWGLQQLANMDSRYNVNIQENGSVVNPTQVGALGIYDGNNIAGDTYIEPGDYWEGLDGLTNTRSVAATGWFDYSMWAWCGQMSYYEDRQIEAYLAAINGLNTQYPNMRYVLMTGHLDGEEGGDLWRHNEMVRTYAQENNGVLFDFADIEHYDPNGVFYAGETDVCNWCISWCSANPTDCRGLPGGEIAHTHPFNCLNKAKAFWWMMARMSGWDDECAAYHPSTTTKTVHVPYLDVDGGSYWVDFKVEEGLLNIDSFGAGKGTGTCATYNAPQIEIECLTLDASGTTYWLNLAPSGAGWRIDTYGIN